MTTSHLWRSAASKPEDFGERAISCRLVASALIATVASHTWLHAFGVPPGMAARRMIQIGAGPSVGLIVLDRKPNSIVAEALMSAAVEVDFAGILQSALDDWLTRPARSG